jgi:hypothetical protein
MVSAKLFCIRVLQRNCTTVPSLTGGSERSKYRIVMLCSPVELLLCQIAYASNGSRFCGVRFTSQLQSFRNSSLRPVKVAAQTMPV